MHAHDGMARIVEVVDHIERQAEAIAKLQHINNKDPMMHPSASDRYTASLSLEANC
jgi:hypothetical protein